MQARHFNKTWASCAVPCGIAGRCRRRGCTHAPQAKLDGCSCSAGAAVRMLARHTSALEALGEAGGGPGGGGHSPQRYRRESTPHPAQRPLHCPHHSAARAGTSAFGRFGRASQCQRLFLNSPGTWLCMVTSWAMLVVICCNPESGLQNLHSIAQQPIAQQGRNQAGAGKRPAVAASRRLATSS